VIGKQELNMIFRVMIDLIWISKFQFHLISVAVSVAVLLCGEY